MSIIINAILSANFNSGAIFTSGLYVLNFFNDGAMTIDLQQRKLTPKQTSCCKPTVYVFKEIPYLFSVKHAWNFFNIFYTQRNVPLPIRKDV